MSKFFTPIFITVFVWCNAGILCWSLARMLCYHVGRHLASENKYADTIVLSAADYTNPAICRKIKKDEVCFRGRMFDIKILAQSAERIVLIGHYDRKDDMLFAFLKDIFGDDDASSKQAGKTFWHFESLIPSEAYRVQRPAPDRFAVITFFCPDTRLVSADRPSSFQPPEYRTGLSLS